MDELNLWKQVPKLSVDEFMNLLFGLVPGTVKFDYGNPESWPKGSAIIHKLLTDDIRAEKLFVMIADPHRDPRISEYFSEIYGLSGNPWWADADGKLFRHQLIEWLEENKIPSKFFGVLQPAVVINARSASTGSRKDIARITATRKACEEVTEELHQEKSAFESNKNNWKPGLLDDTGRTTKKIFMETAQNRLSEKLHRDTAVEAWRNVPTELKHRGRVREQLSSTESTTY